MAHKRKDILWKGTIEDFPEDFMRFFYKNAEEVVDFNAGFEFLDKELQQIAPDYELMQDAAIADKLIKFKSIKTPSLTIVLLIEIQGKDEKDFVLRVYKYFNRLMDKYDNQVMVLVIYTDSNKHYRPSSTYLTQQDTSIQFNFKSIYLHNLYCCFIHTTHIVRFIND